ncbi:MAG: aminotransferase class I/II-fold pyridoxal phosphate-dependent enzyme, partial [Treponema sp.]|nr:aminotransferase class I/II-fold pyridoxal phosphate-dependent enzyme [Treponema sp.]
RSISKEVPWPGARCGWAEIYNRKADPRFDAYIKSLLDSKRLEVCSTSMPQLCIPAIMGDPRYGKHLETRAAMFEKRADEMEKAFAGVSGILMKKPSGAFYVSAVFDNVLNENSDSRSLPVSDESLRDYIRAEIAGLKPDKQFVYWLLASTGICVVPLSGFATDLPGFRFTLLEYDDEKRKWIFNTLAEAVRNYLR